ncbi:membrane protein [Salmonella bongori serovar 48:z41:-- str. RKS3044]|nr:membrane protein [Salmonella bongori serovar 48:z41:-- str. RKS3044]
MKIATVVTALALFSTPSLVMAAPGSCERVKSDIEQRIINNGVPADNFTLTIVPNDQADQPDSQVVGHCANDTHKILYTRTSSGNAPANSTPSQDGSSTEPQ